MKIRARTSVSLPQLLKDCVQPVQTMLVEPPARGPSSHRARESVSVNVALDQLSLHEVCELFDVEFDFRKVGSVVIDYRWKGNSDTITLAQFVEMLRMGPMKPRVVAVCQALARGDLHLLIVVLAALRSRRIAVHPQIEPQLVVFAARALLALNATDTAYREGAGLLANEEATAELSKGELERLRSLVSRAACRSGRSAVAFDMCTRLFAQEADSVERFEALRPLA